MGKEPARQLMRWRWPSLPHVYCRQLLCCCPFIYPTLYLIPKISWLLFSFSLTWHVTAVRSFTTLQSMWLMDHLFVSLVPPHPSHLAQLSRSFLLFSFNGTRSAAHIRFVLHKQLQFVGRPLYSSEHCEWSGIKGEDVVDLNSIKWNIVLLLKHYVFPENLLFC